jgi:undecaprenyl-diphosphatase
VITVRKVGSLPLLAAALLVVGLVALLLDVPLAIWLEGNRLSGELLRPFKFAEIGGHGTGAAMLLLATLWLRRQRWTSGAAQGAVPLRLVAATYLGGLLVDGLKLVVPRVRPRFADLAPHLGAIDTFGRQLLELGEDSRAALMSFPSGHSAIAAGLAAALCWFHPPGRAVFLCLAGLACLQRLLSGAHYLSDVCIGASIGLLGAWLALHSIRAPRLFALGEPGRNHAGS